MKTFFITLHALMLTTIINAQSLKFNGDWTGSITIFEKGKTLNVRLVIDSNKVIQYFDDDHEDSWYTSKSPYNQCNYNSNNLLFYWMNNTKLLSETQTYSLSFVNNKKLYVSWTRQLNITGKEGSNNDTWSLQGSGYLVRSNNDVANRR
jgi:hypothetical protein